MIIFPQAFEARFTDDALGCMLSTARLRFFQLKRFFFKKQLMSSLLVMCMSLCIWTPPPARQITLKLLLLCTFDVVMTYLITLFWALWFWRDPITQYILHRVPCIASAWWHSLWGCGCHDNPPLKIHNLSLPPSVVQMFTFSWGGGMWVFFVCFLYTTPWASNLSPDFSFKVKQSF